MAKRIIVVGDVHGCFDELQNLLEKCEVTSDDWLVSIGDAVDRGPKVREVVDLFMRRDLPNQRSMVLGNHEERQLKYYSTWQNFNPWATSIGGKMPPFRGDVHKASFLSLDIKHFEWLKTLPKFIRLSDPYVAPDGLPITFVHAGCLPEVPIEYNTDLIRLHCSDIMPPSQGFDLEYGVQHGYWRPNTRTWWTSKAPPGAKFWGSIYDGASGHIVFGHSGFTKVARFPHATGIDLGACFGRELCALILPEWRFMTVPAKKCYASKAGKAKLYEVYPGIEVFS